MPAITAPLDSTILVTGANGFVAAWVIGKLLEHGYAVRAAVRSESKGEYLQKLYKSFGAKLSLFIVGSMNEPGVWDDAVKNVHGIIHTAAQVNLSAVEPSEIIDPAVNGTLEILRSVLKHGSSVSRIVYTSSCAAIKDFNPDTAITLSEVDWNDAVVSEVEKLGAKASGLAKYSASKTFAERALWDFLEKNKDKIKFDATAINPPWIFGPPKNVITDPDDLNDSNAFLYKAIVHADFGGMEPTTMPSHGWISVRDVAEALVRSLSVPEAGGERIIVCAGSPYVWNDWVYTVHALSPPPEFVVSHSDLPQISENPKHHSERLGITFDTSKQARILGIEYSTMQEVARDILDDYTRRGW